MLFACENGGLKIYADTYTLEFAQDRPYVYLDDQGGRRLADLFVLSSIHALNGRDDTTRVGQWQVEEGLDEVSFTLEVASSIWESKIIRFRCRPRRFTYEVEVCGSGQIAEAVYFGGYSSASLRWGSGFFSSGQRFEQAFNPEPTCDEIYTFSADVPSVINLTGVPLPGRGDWFFTPPPFCFAFDFGKGWLGMGLEARPGENRFVDYQYQGGRNAFHLVLNYEGHTSVQGRYRLPAIAFDFGPDPYMLLAMHVQHLHAAGLVPQAEAAPRPTWWSEPIFCGWGAQCYLSRVGGGRASDYATQASYEAFLHTLTDRGLFPGTVVIDDKWQATYGENAVDPTRWPDLPGFINARHEDGQHVLLWIKAWDPQGVPVEECITNAAGLPLAIDPTHPAGEQRLRRSIRRMLAAQAEGGYDADGFKIDFSARIPSGPGIRLHGSTWGLELMRRYLWIIRDEARKVKPDAFIITHTPHAYLADLIDAIRLNDINTGHDICSQMTHRARVAAIACPNALIDMDNWPIPSIAGWRQYLALRPILGIPALYFASHIDSTGEALSEEDYALIRAQWSEYRQRYTSRHAARVSSAKLRELGGAYLPGLMPPFKRLVLGEGQTEALKPLKAWDKQTLPGQA